VFRKQWLNRPPPPPLQVTPMLDTRNVKKTMLFAVVVVGNGETYTLARGGVEGTQFRRSDRHSGTLCIL
jgi:hypothetical protein